MPIKPIIQIDIDDSKYKEFLSLFDKYKEELKNVPSALTGLTEGSTAIEQQMSRILDALKQQKREEEGIRDTSKSGASTARSTAVVWSSITESVLSVNRNLTHATSQLIKWSSISTAVTGLLGLGGLFGFERLASSVSNRRRQAMGLGLSYGQNLALGANYSQLINPQTLIDNVATARYDITSPQYGALVSAGISHDALSSGNTYSVTAEVLARLPALLGRYKNQPGMIGPMAKAYGIDSLMSNQDIIAFLNATPEEQKRLARQAASDADNFKLTEDAQRKWADFTTQLNRAGTKIGVIFADKLSALAPGLEHLSEVLVKDLEDLLKGDEVDKFLEKVDGWIKSAADELGSDDFQERAKAFVSGIVDMAVHAEAFMEKFVSDPAYKKIMSMSQASASEADGSGGVSGSIGFEHPMATRPRDRNYFPSPSSGGNSSPLLDPHSAHPSGGLTDLITRDAEAAAGGPGPKADAIRRRMEGIRSGESYRNNKYDVYITPREQSYGPFQMNRINGGLGSVFEAETAAERKKLGLGDLTDPRTIPLQAAWVAKYIADGRSLSPWGGPNWPSHTPREADPAWGDSGYLPDNNVPSYLRDKNESAKQDASTRNFDYWHSSGKQPTISIRSAPGAEVPTSAFLISAPYATVPTQ